MKKQYSPEVLELGRRMRELDNEENLFLLNTKNSFTELDDDEEGDVYEKFRINFISDQRFFDEVIEYEKEFPNTLKTEIEEYNDTFGEEQKLLRVVKCK